MMPGSYDNRGYRLVVVREHGDDGPHVEVLKNFGPTVPFTQVRAESLAVCRRSVGRPHALEYLTPHDWSRFWWYVEPTEEMRAAEKERQMAESDERLRRAIAERERLRELKAKKKGPPKPYNLGRRPRR
jgi:hypothetical protein